MGMPLSRRQKSWDILDQSAIAYARQHKIQPHQDPAIKDKSWRSLDLSHGLTLGSQLGHLPNSNLITANATSAATSPNPIGGGVHFGAPSASTAVAHAAAAAYSGHRHEFKNRRSSSEP
uniref:Uncharacterized protein n=1 Tax=Lutzomyia longipalpis TaxID=7200 RepID=A0A1B0CJ35_LUTLO